MKKILFVFALAAVVLTGCNKKSLPPVAEPSWYTNTTYFAEKNGLYSELPVYPKNIVMVGDDYIDRGLWNEFYGDTTVKNRGITYDATDHVLYRIDRIAKQKPGKIFVSAGLNDLLHGTAVDTIVANVKHIFTRVSKLSPETKCYYMNIVLSPVLSEEQKAAGAKVNEAIHEYAKGGAFECIDVNAALQQGIEDGRFSWDGGKLLNGAGYSALAKAIERQIGKPALNLPDDREYPLEVSDYYKHRVSMLRSLPKEKGRIVMLGNSLTNNAPWPELFPLGYIVNRGISGDVVDGVHQRIDMFEGTKPDKFFLMTGTNDFVNDPEVSALKVWERFESLIKDIREQYPTTWLYVQSILPMNPKSPYYAGFNEKAAEVNKLLDAGKERYSYVYLDIASLVSDGNGDLKDECTCDGIHLSATGYFIWSAELAKGLRMMQNLDPTEMLFENN